MTGVIALGPTGRDAGSEASRLGLGGGERLPDGARGRRVVSQAALCCPAAAKPAAGEARPDSGAGALLERAGVAESAAAAGLCGDHDARHAGGGGWARAAAASSNRLQRMLSTMKRIVHAMLFGPKSL